MGVCQEAGEVEEADGEEADGEEEADDERRGVGPASGCDVAEF